MKIIVEADSLEELKDLLGKLVGTPSVNLDSTRQSQPIPMDCPTELLPLSLRTRNVLRAAGLRDLRAFASMSDDDLLKIKNAGLRSQIEVRSLLNGLGIFVIPHRD